MKTKSDINLILKGAANSKSPLANEVIDFMLAQKCLSKKDILTCSDILYKEGFVEGSKLIVKLTQNDK